MRLLSVFVSYQRLGLLAETLESYQATVGDTPHDIVIVDNASDRATRLWLTKCGHTVLMLPSNMYPGYATNRGWRLADETHTILHRSDNDILYLEGWAGHLRETLDAHPEWGQVSLRTDFEENYQDAVGGNNAIRREVWDAGVRYTDRPWTDVPWEDGLFNGEVRAAGFGWGRVTQPCIVHEGAADKHDPYYIRSHAERGISKTLENL